MLHANGTAGRTENQAPLTSTSPSTTDSKGATTDSRGVGVVRGIGKRDGREPGESSLIDSAQIEAGVRTCEEIGPVALKAMHYLLKANTYAQELRVDTWDFAVEIEFLKRLDIGANELRWLVASGWLDHAAEITAPGDERRVFGRGGYLMFDAETCFVLTEPGVSVACALSERQKTTLETHTVSNGNGSNGNGSNGSGPNGSVHNGSVHNGSVHNGSRPNESGHQETQEKPQWIADRQKLYLGGDLVKEFKLPSPNQTTILAAFEEEQWPAHVDDPLPVCATVGPKERLRYTIKSLNKHQKKRMIRFRGDGRGQGICWEVWEHQTSS